MNEKVPSISDVLNEEIHDVDRYGHQSFSEVLDEVVVDIPSGEVVIDAERTTHESDSLYKLPKVPNMRVLRAYQDFFELGPQRSVAELCRQYRKLAEQYGREAVPTISAPVLYKWRKKYDWDIQVRADELDLYEQSRAAKKENAKKMVERQTGYARVSQTIGYSFLRRLIDDHGNLTDEALKILTPSEARRLILDGSKLEMDLHGGKQQLESDSKKEIAFE